MRRIQYWQKTKSLTVSLLLLWAFVAFVVNAWSAELNQWSLLGFPLGFYMAAQGDLLIFLGIIWGYNRVMNRLDEAYRADPEDSGQAP